MQKNWEKLYIFYNINESPVKPQWITFMSKARRRRRCRQWPQTTSSLELKDISEMGWSQLLFYIFFLLFKGIQLFKSLVLLKFNKYDFLYFFFLENPSLYDKLKKDFSFSDNEREKVWNWKMNWLGTKSRISIFRKDWLSGSFTIKMHVNSSNRRNQIQYNLLDVMSLTLIVGDFTEHNSWFKWKEVIVIN